MRIPVAMYGIQSSPSFDFQAAREAIPYIAELGMKDHSIKAVRGAKACAPLPDAHQDHVLGRARHISGNRTLGSQSRGP